MMEAAMLLASDACNAAIDRRQTGTGDAAGGRLRRLLVNPDDFCGWLAMAMPGDATVYYRGHLGRDRCRSTGRLPEPHRQRLIALARQALLAAEDGRVHLLQRRHGDGDYSYTAVKARVSERRAARPRPIQDEEQQMSRLPDLSMTPGAALPSSRSCQCQSAREVA